MREKEEGTEEEKRQGRENEWAIRKQNMQDRVQINYRGYLVFQK